MSILRTEKHEIFRVHVNKTSLSAFDTKRWIADDGLCTNAYGYNPTLTDEEEEELWRWLNEALGE